MKISARAAAGAMLPTLIAVPPAMAEGSASPDLTIGSIISTTPTWVWVLLVLLVYFGLRATQTRTLGFFGYVIFPVIMVFLSVNALAMLRLDDANLAAIAGGAILGVAGGAVLERRFAPVPLGGGRLRLQGELTNLITVLVVFSSRHASSVVMAVDPPLAAAREFQLCIAVISAFFAAMLLSRILLRLLVAYGPKASISEAAAAE